MPARTQAPTQPTRPIFEIARDIYADWTSPYFGASPHMEAMRSLDRITDPYGADSGRSIVLYFLGNAAAWRGEKARAIKAELKRLANS